MDPIVNISFTGLDTNGIVNQLIELERLPIQRLSARQDTFRSQSRRFEELSASLSSLSDAAQNLNERSEVLLSNASSSDETRLSTTATGDASLGTYRLNVTQLAQAERTYSDTFAAKDQAGLFGTGTLSIDVGTNGTVDIDVTAADTLETLADKINASDARVSAGVVFDGSAYRLQVGGEETGAANAITFTETGLSLGLDNPANELVSAQDAVFDIDGLAMTSASNTVTEAIAGVSFELLNTTETDSPVAISVARSESDFTDSVRSFVDAYNDVVGKINAEFDSNGLGGSSASLSGDSTLRTLQSQLSQTALSIISDAPTGSQRLGEVGIEINEDGTLELNEDALQESFASDPNALVELFAGNQTAGTDGLMKSFEDLAENYTKSQDGLLTIRIDSFDDQVEDLESQKERLERRVESREEILRAQFTRTETLANTLTSQYNQLFSALGLGTA